MAKPRGKSLYPYPVYVAWFRDGEQARMSFWQAAKGPWRADIGRRVVEQAIGNERFWSGKWTPDKLNNVRQISYRFLSGPGTCAHPPADDLLFGYVEHNGKPVQGTMFLAPEMIARLAARDPRTAAIALPMTAERKAA
jgi:hypothetical protein